MLPGTTDGMKHVCHFRHALALDEKRVNFLPEYAHGGTSLSPISTEKQGDPSGNVKEVVNAQIPAVEPDVTVLNRGSKEPTRKLQQTKEVWFAGTHSDM